jgi:hypothetical protein
LGPVFFFFFFFFFLNYADPIRPGPRHPAGAGGHVNFFFLLKKKFFPERGHSLAMAAAKPGPGGRGISWGSAGSLCMVFLLFFLFFLFFIFHM